MLFQMSCSNFSETIKDYVNEGVHSAQTTQAKEIKSAHEHFLKTYQQYKRSLADSIELKKAITLYQSVSNNKLLLDSFIYKMQSLDYQNPENIAEVKRIFITETWGDFIFKAIHASYTLGEDIANVEATKLKLNKAKQTFLPKNLKHFFELNNPLGVSIFLSSTEKELLDAASESMQK